MDVFSGLIIGMIVGAFIMWGIIQMTSTILDPGYICTHQVMESGGGGTQCFQWTKALVIQK